MIEDLKEGERVRDLYSGEVGRVVRIMPYSVTVEFGKGYNSHLSFLRPEEIERFVPSSASREKAFLLWLEGRVGEKLNRWEKTINEGLPVDRCREELGEARRELLGAFVLYFGEKRWVELKRLNFESGWKLEMCKNWERRG